MKITEKASLKNFNSFKIDAKSDYLIEIESQEDLFEFSNSEHNKNEHIYILGGGCNILFTKDFKGVLLHSVIKDIELISETDSEVIVKCGSGVEWDSFVEYCTQKNWGGIENLSDIPGDVGSAPVQNIGAYGVEAKDTILKVEAYNYKTSETIELDNAACKFGYRDSIFKTLDYKNVFISYVFFKLSKTPKLITHYGNLEEELIRSNEKNIKNLRKIIINTRQAKLPETDDLGSGGSFFKNPVIEASLAENLSKAYPEMPKYQLVNNKFKLSAAWLIDKAGLKDFRIGDVGTYKNQALVIVNYGGATGKEIKDFSETIQKIVNDKYGILLEPEVIFM